MNALKPGMVGQYWDRESVLTLRLANGISLLSASENDLLVQPLNVFTCGGEVCQYANATDLGNGMWRLDTFMRGLRGTENRIDTHTVGEKFVRISSAVNRIITSKAELNQLDDFRVVSTYADSSTAQNFTFTDTGNCLKPYTVYVLATHRDADTGDVSVTFVPRPRQGGKWLDDEVTLPTNDKPETYEIAVCTSASAASEVAKYVLTGDAVNFGATFTYTAAQQTTDLGAPKPEVHLAIYQISTIIGRGFGVGVTL
jgi:hypothetical protein